MSNLEKVDIRVFGSEAENAYRIQVEDDNTGARTPWCEIPSRQEFYRILTQMGATALEVSDTIKFQNDGLIRDKMIDIDKIQRLLEPYHPK